MAIQNPRQWSPDSPFLYNLTVSLAAGGRGAPVDAVRAYFGMRTVSLGLAAEYFISCVARVPHGGTLL
jgi:beta-galactosidase/beta-glucuronidase